MIDTLVASSTSMESVTVHFFCDYADQKTLCAVEIFGSLAKQLLSAFKRIPEEMEKMIRNAYGDGTLIPDASTVLEILLAAVKLFSRVYIVLDGVDECRGEDRLEVIAAIRTMSSADPEKSALGCLFRAVEMSTLRGRWNTAFTCRSTPKTSHLTSNRSSRALLKTKNIRGISLSETLVF